MFDYLSMVAWMGKRASGKLAKLRKTKKINPGNKKGRVFIWFSCCGKE